MRSVGQRVWDLASKREATIVEAHYLAKEPATYRLDDSVPLDPTGDGAFPTRWRHDGELCAPSRARTRQPKFAY